MRILNSFRNFILCVLLTHYLSISYCQIAQASIPDTSQSNHIYSNSIKTFEIYNDQFELSLPIIELNGSQKLYFSFDELNSSYNEYAFTLTHCDFKWQPSPLNQNEYLKGFFEDFITNHQSSQGTSQQYIHYSASFPNDNIQPILSGNYLLKIYPVNAPEKPIITWRILIIETGFAQISANISPSSNPDQRTTHQEIDFSIFSSVIEYPNENLKVSILQNFRWENAIQSLKPRFIKNNEFDYNYENVNSFAAGNEFRFFDTKSLQYASEHVSQIQFINQQNHVFLYKDDRRTFKPYFSYRDINGKFFIKNQDNIADPDYAWVHFTLNYPNPIFDGNIYIIGPTGNQLYSSINKMNYNYQLKQYELALYLKQGYYNYLYTYIPNNTNASDLSFIENSFSETENSYTIIAYYRAPSDLHYRIIALSSFNSSK